MTSRPWLWLGAVACALAAFLYTRSVAPERERAPSYTPIDPLALECEVALTLMWEEQRAYPMSEADLAQLERYCRRHSEWAQSGGQSVFNDLQ